MSPIVSMDYVIPQSYSNIPDDPHDHVTKLLTARFFRHFPQYRGKVKSVRRTKNLDENQLIVYCKNGHPLWYRSNPAIDYAEIKELTKKQEIEL